MFQQYIAYVVIILFMLRLYGQKSSGKISQSEFVFWLVFWLLGGLAIVFIKKIDDLVARLGFSANGIDILLYLAVIILFYLIFRLRLRQERIEKNITVLTRELALKEKIKIN